MKKRLRNSWAWESNHACHGLRVFQELKEAESWVNVQVQAHEGAEAEILKLGMPVEQLKREQQVAKTGHKPVTVYEGKEKMCREQNEHLQ